MTPETGAPQCRLLLKIRHALQRATRYRTTTLSDVISPTLTLACKACVRKGVYSVARLMAKHGDVKTPDLRRFLSADCPKHKLGATANQCQAQFDPQPELRRERPTW